MRVSAYRHIFFDLDNTIWDFDGSSAEAFRMLYEHFRLHEKGVESLNQFLKNYHQHNDALWALYREGGIEKEVLRSLRFKLTLESFGIREPGLDVELSDFYLHYAPRIVRLEPGAFELLSYLSGRYSLHLITNGFSEVQQIKLSHGRIGHFFEQIITSEEAGAKKPDPAIFRLAIMRSGAHAHESLMVGDDLEADIAGAMAIGMDQVFYNPTGIVANIAPTYEIRSLSELRKML